MDCYKITVNESCSGGCAIIAATSEQEAIDRFRLVEYNDYIYKFYGCKCELVPKLHYDTETPRSIIDTIYIP